MVTRCPLCRQPDLHVYQDVLFHGEWFHCRGCQTSGDMIELSSLVWKLRIPETIFKLREQGVPFSPELLAPAAIQQYRETHLRYRTSIANFWSKAQVYFKEAANPQLRALQRRFLPPDILGDTWVARGGQLIGAASKQVVERLMRPKTVEYAEQSRTPGAGRGRNRNTVGIFPGKGWDELLVVPFFDLPGRPCAFLLIGREANPANGDYIFWPMSPYKSKHYEAGLAFQPALLQQRGPSESLVICDDTHLALQLQLKHLRSSGRFLPVSLSHTGELAQPRNIWAWAAPPIVFCSTKLTPDLFTNARWANGKIFVQAMSPAEIDQRLLHRPPQLWLRMITEGAVHWSEALRRQLPKLDPVSAEQLVRQMQFSPLEREEFINGCEPELRQRLEAIWQSPVLVRSVRYNNKTVYERNGGWYYSGKGERHGADSLICNCIIRVDQTLHTERRQYYRGTITYRGQTVPFLEKVETLERGVLPWAAQHLRDVAKLPGVLNYHPGWAKKALGLIFHFHDPQPVNGIDAIGWNPETARFNFPQFSLAANGDVTTDTVCLLDDAHVPAKGLRPPQSMPREHIQILSQDNDEVRLFWATAAAVISGVVAPMFNRTPQGVLLDGDGAHAIGSVLATRFGCPWVAYSRQRPFAEFIRTAQRPHRWPLGVTWHTPDWGVLDRQLLSNLIMRVPGPVARIFAIRNHATVIRCTRKLGTVQLTGDCAPGVLPGYLQYMCAKRYGLPGTTNRVAPLVHSLAEWFGSEGGDEEIVRSSLSMLDQREPWEQFLELAFQCYDTQLLDHTRASHDPGNRRQPSFVSLSDDEVWIPQNGFSDAVNQLCQMRPDMLLITNSLRTHGALLREDQYRETQGWVLKTDWWESQFCKWEMSQ